jgi:CubicO group peptidase (beta-lactamase class C family)
MRRSRTCWTAVAAIAVAAPVAAQSTVPDSVVRGIDAVFARYTSKTPGCAVGVFQNGAIAFAKGYGLANIEFDDPIPPQTPCILGSVSKEFTAAALALLVEQGRLSLNDDVRKYVPELHDYGRRVTIDNLVHHTSGIRDFWALVDLAGMRPDDGYTVDDVVALASRQRDLNFNPGDAYAYSNTGYVLLGVVVQRVTGKTLRQFEAEQVFGPLGMTSSQFHDDHNEPVKGRVIAYSPAPNGRWKIDVWNNDIVGQGGLMTTIGDLQKWDENFYTGKVGGPGFLARQLQQGVLNNGTKLAYAFGLEIGEYLGLKMVEHSGSTGGYRTDISRFPAQHTSVATMCNVSNADATRLAHGVADAVLATAFTKPAPTPPVRAANAAAQQGSAGLSLSAADLDALAGRYYSDELDATYELTRNGTALMLRRARSGPDTVRAMDRQTFRAAGATLHFAAGSPSPSFTVDAGRARGIEFVRVSDRMK